MKLPALLLLTAISAWSAQTDVDDKLAATSAESAYRAALIRLLQIQADPIYRKALAEVEAAEASRKQILAEIGKRLGCEIDPATVDCKPGVIAK